MVLSIIVNHSIVVAIYLVVALVLTPSMSNANNGNPKPGKNDPDFTELIENITVPVGRDATFRCLVKNLGKFKVGWVKSDTKAIQAIHERVITPNPRISVSHNDFTTWNLHIKHVQENDRGQYMCQINTNPMKSQLGYLNVVVPPDITDYADQTSDIVAPEGGTVELRCRARGHPPPKITWRREDASHIVIRDGQRTKAYHIFEGEALTIPKVSRTDMGAYLCIASNGVPPTVSRRFVVSVQFHPLIQVPNQLLGAPINTDVTLECFVEASPKAINYWVRDSGEMIISSEKYLVSHTPRSVFEERLLLTVKKLKSEDFGTYKCLAKNILGEEESSIRIYEIPGPRRKGSDHLTHYYDTSDARNNDVVKLNRSELWKSEKSPRHSDSDSETNDSTTTHKGCLLMCVAMTVCKYFIF